MIATVTLLRRAATESLDAMFVMTKILLPLEVWHPATFRTTWPELPLPPLLMQSMGE